MICFLFLSSFNRYNIYWEYVLSGFSLHGTCITVQWDTWWINKMQNMWYMLWWKTKHVGKNGKCQSITEVIWNFRVFLEITNEVVTFEEKQRNSKSKAWGYLGKEQTVKGTLRETTRGRNFCLTLGNCRKANMNEVSKGKNKRY